MNIPLEQTVDHLIRQMSNSSPSERIEAFDKLSNTYCSNCGKYHGTGSKCQCWNEIVAELE